MGEDIQWWGKRILMGEGRGVEEGRDVRGYPVAEEESSDGGGEGSRRGVGEDCKWWGKRVLMGERRGMEEGRSGKG